METVRQHIAVGTDKHGRVWSGHFGIAPYYSIYNHDGDLLETRPNPQGAGSGVKVDHHHHHDDDHDHDDDSGPRRVMQILPECKVFIARAMGHPDVVRDLGIHPVLTKEKEPDAALRVYLESVAS